MPMQTPEMEGASIVMVGSFNPTIFQPRWLGSQQLIRAEEADNAKITVIQAEVADFSIDWFHLQVVQSRFVLASADPRHYAPLRDLASAMFAILPHTPIRAMGLNRQFHFKMRSERAWHAVGHVLAPKDPWNALLDRPGLRSMLMEGRRKGVEGGTSHVKVEPSSKVPHGLYIEVNEEFLAPPEDGPEPAQWVPERLAEHWEAVMRFSETAAEHLLNLARD